jgi:serine protease inhibitor
VDLKEKLMKAGVTDIFSQDKANFATISDTKLSVENVIHVAKIKVRKIKIT